MKLYTADAIKEQVHKLLCKDCEESDVCSVCDYRELINEILDAPTVDAEPMKHGEWIEQDGYDGDVYYDCSVCGNSWTTIDGTPQDNGMNYCPSCGAKMDEVCE